VPRSGSTYVSHLLWQTGCLGAPLEYCNYTPGSPYGHAAHSPAEQQRLWRSALERRTSPNGVFGLKGFPGQFHELQQGNPALLAEVMRTLIPSREDGRVVLFRRRDRTAHAISYARASLSGIWRAEQERAGRAEPEYSRLAVERAGRMIEVQEEAWRAMLGDLRIAPLELWYEDTLADPAAAVDAVADYLGVEIDPAAAVRVPPIERQSQGGARDWAKRHSQR
jgi:LPS sulfotransferase NodH